MKLFVVLFVILFFSQVENRACQIPTGSEIGGRCVLLDNTTALKGIQEIKCQSFEDQVFPGQQFQPVCISGFCALNERGCQCKIDTDCEPGVNCVGGYCFSKRENNKAVGEVCDSQKTCKRGAVCVSGSCVAAESLTTGQTCVAHAVCKSRFCLAGVCTEPLAIGTACTSDVQCISKSCLEGKCFNVSAPRKTGEKCHIDDDCFPNATCWSSSVCVLRRSMKEGQLCETSADCPINMACYSENGTTPSYCRKREGLSCNIDSDCADSQYCQLCNLQGATGVCVLDSFKKSFTQNDELYSQLCMKQYRELMSSGCAFQFQQIYQDTDGILPTPKCQKLMASTVCCFGCFDNQFQFSPIAQAIKGMNWNCDPNRDADFMELTENRANVPCCQAISNRFCPGETFTFRECSKYPNPNSSSFIVPSIVTLFLSALLFF